MTSSAPDPGHSPNLARLADGLDALDPGDPGARNVGVNRCHRAQCLTRMPVRQPTLMIPVAGTKRIRTAGQAYAARPGEMLVLPPGIEIDVDNLPDPRQGRFACAVLVFDAATLTAFGKLYGAQMGDWAMPPRWQAPGTEELFSAVAGWLAHSRSFAADAMQTRHRMAELLLLLARQGVAGNLLFQSQARLGERVRHMLALDLARQWRLSDLTDRLGMSDSTLRRQLRAEGTPFRELLETVRLDRGMELVMFTDMPISQVAFDCGYLSQSRFAERFRLRFSLSPTELRATQRQQGGQVVAMDRRRG